METSAIRYRVADFLKEHPPFNAMEDADLVALAANGRVRFYEANEFILWQGEPHKVHVFVIQQGTVSLWDERRGVAALRDVRGAGDLLGVEQFNGARAVLLSARSTSDVVVYGFQATDFGELLTKYPLPRDSSSLHWAPSSRTSRGPTSGPIRGGCSCTTSRVRCRSAVSSTASPMRRGC